MPHIKSLRLVNVHFNNSTQFYDNFTLDFNGYNVTYDLENGGGKSLLLLMILQTVLPKSYLRREKPVSLIFQGGKDRTSHSVVEWALDEGSRYKYMLTGFAARKRKNRSEVVPGDGDEEQISAGDIEHLSWCIFYNNELRIKDVPLAKSSAKDVKEYAGFEDIRNYIRQIKQKNMAAQTFDSIEEYQRYIAAHNLISAEWNIIKGNSYGKRAVYITREVGTT